MKSARGLAFGLGLLIAGGASNLVGMTPSAQQAPAGKKSTERAYDGNWWLKREPDERSAFTDGASDCLFYVAHAKWLSRNVDDLEKKIDQYYESHQNERGALVLTVWQNVLASAPPAKPRPSGGEVWTNPHGYSDGAYWSQLNYDATRQAFLEGYLSCLRTCVSKPTETYSRPAAYYVPKISGYIKVRPKTAYNEAIADILSRFRDNPNQAVGKSNRPHQ